MALSDDDVRGWTDELIGDIEDGYYDDVLMEIVEAIRERNKVARKARAAKTARSLAPGIRVSMADNIVPKYLRGLTGTVDSVDVRTRKARVMLDNPRMARRYASAIDGSTIVPCNLLNVL